MQLIKDLSDWLAEPTRYSILTTLLLIAVIVWRRQLTHPFVYLGTMVGMTIRYPPNRTYFFLNPVDPKSNNLRILVNREAVTEMELVDVG